MKILLSIFFLSFALYGNEQSLNCLMACDNHDPLFYHDWQYQKSSLNSTKPDKPNVINCFNPAILCMVPCKENSNILATWKKANEKVITKLKIEKINIKSKTCFIKSVLPIKPLSGISIMPITPLLLGEGVVNIKLDSNMTSLFYKATSGE